MSGLRDRVIEEHINKNYPNSKISKTTITWKKNYGTPR